MRASAAGGATTRGAYGGEESGALVARERGVQPGAEVTAVGLSRCAPRSAARAENPQKRGARGRLRGAVPEAEARAGGPSAHNRAVSGGWPASPRAPEYAPA